MKKKLVPSFRTYADLVRDSGRLEEFIKSWIRGVITSLNEVDEATAKRILKKSGENCCKIFMEVHKYYLSGQELASLIKLLDSSPNAGCWKEDENTIIYEFCSKRCECPLVEEKIVELSPRLCSACFTNWLIYMFGTVTGKEVKADLIESLATGASKCAFKIELI